MAHSAQMKFFELVYKYFPEHFQGRVIDIGSLDINGGPHQLFTAKQYVGVDLAPGPNVDLVSRGEDVDFPSGSFDVAMSSECFEHNENWQASFINMHRLTRPGGLVIFSCATLGRPEHGTSRSDGGFSAPFVVKEGSEYYRNVSELRAVTAAARLPFSMFWTLLEPLHCDLFFVGIKRGSTPRAKATLQEFRRDADKTFSKGYVPPNSRRIRSRRKLRLLIASHQAVTPLIFLGSLISKIPRPENRLLRN